MASSNWIIHNKLSVSVLNYLISGAVELGSRDAGRCGWVDVGIRPRCNLVSAEQLSYGLIMPRMRKRRQRLEADGEDLCQSTFSGRSDTWTTLPVHHTQHIIIYTFNYTCEWDIKKRAEFEFVC